jgi:glutathione S-transferase
VRAQGGFLQLGLPLSRIFDADAGGRNAGWTAYVYYGYDQALARDARRFVGGARGSRSDLFLSSLQYKLNTFVTFAYEQGYYRTRAANRVGALPLFRGIPSYATHNVRSEFATIFSF